MSTKPRRLAAAALVSLLGLVLCACAGLGEPRITRLPTDGVPAPAASASAPAATTSATPPPAPAVTPDAAAEDCAAGPVTITPGSPPAVLRGDCPQVDVQGNAFDVDLTGARVTALTVSGDRVTVAVAAAGTLLIRGNDVVLTAAEAGALDIQGDRNSVTVTGTLSSVSFQGNDNVVHGSSSNVTDAGARNTVG